AAMPQALDARDRSWASRGKRQLLPRWRDVDDGDRSRPAGALPPPRGYSRVASRTPPTQGDDHVGVREQYTRTLDQKDLPSLYKATATSRLVRTTRAGTVRPTVPCRSLNLPAFASTLAWRSCGSATPCACWP